MAPNQMEIGAMPKRKRPELSPEEQSKRFISAGKKAGVSKSETDFERAFLKVAHRVPNGRMKKEDKTSGK